MPVTSPVPDTVRPSRDSETSPPIASRMSRIASPAWVVCCGQPGTVTRPPVTRAAARAIESLGGKLVLKRGKAADIVAKVAKEHEAFCNALGAGGAEVVVAGTSLPTDPDAILLRDTATGLAAFESAPCYRELVGAEDDEVAAGAEILTANTFRTHRRTISGENTRSPER